MWRRRRKQSNRSFEVVTKFGVGRVVASGVSLMLVAGALYGQSPSVGQNDSAQIASAAAPAAGSATAQTKPHDNQFVIGNDDVLAIDVWNEKEITRSVPVRSDGKISLPLVGEVQATGRTPLQLEGDISERLRNYITTPQVTVIVEQINSQKFIIMGQITKPGTYSIPVAPTVMDAIAAAGGFRDFAKQTKIYILRQNPAGGESRIPFNYKEYIKGRNPGQNIKLEPHDTIVVP